MNYITQVTKDLLVERGIDLTSYGYPPLTDTPQSWVIDFLREEHGIIVNVRYSNKITLLPVWYGMIFKENSTRFWKRVPLQSNSYEEMTEVSIQEGIKLLPNKSQ